MHKLFNCSAALLLALYCFGCGSNSVTDGDDAAGKEAAAAHANDQAPPADDAGRSAPASRDTGGKR